MTEFLRKGATILLVLSLVVLSSPLQAAATSSAGASSTTQEKTDQVVIAVPDVIDDPSNLTEESAPDPTSAVAPQKQTVAVTVAAPAPKTLVATTVPKAELPEVTEEAEPEATPQEPADWRVSIINSAQLRPTDPQSEDLDAYLDNLMDGIVAEDMTTYEKAKACYDYLVNNTRYGSHTAGLSSPIGSLTAGQIYSQFGEVEGYGAVVLSTNQGMCNAYSAGFILMAREIGLDARLVKGSTRSAWGGYTQHQWAEVQIGDQIYVFDPQLEQNLTRAGLGVDNVFCRTYSEFPGRYLKG